MPRTIEVLVPNPTNPDGDDIVLMAEVEVIRERVTAPCHTSWVERHVEILSVFDEGEGDVTNWAIEQHEDDIVDAALEAGL